MFYSSMQDSVVRKTQNAFLFFDGLKRHDWPSWIINLNGNNAFSSMKNHDVASNTNLVRNWSTNGHVAQVNRL